MWRKSAPLTTMLLHTFWIGDKVCNISRNLWMDLDGCNAFSGAIQNNEKCNNITLEYFNLISYHRQQDLNGNPAAAKAACHFAFGIWPNCLCKTRSLQGNLPTFPNVFLHDKDLSWPQGCNSNGFLRGVWVNFDHLCIDELRQLGQAFTSLCRSFEIRNAVMNRSRKVSQVVIFQVVPDFLSQIPFPGLKECKDSIWISYFNMIQWHNMEQSK